MAGQPLHTRIILFVMFTPTLSLCHDHLLVHDWDSYDVSCVDELTITKKT